MAAANFKPIELLGKQVSFIYESFGGFPLVVEGQVTHVVLSLCENYEFCVKDAFYSPENVTSFEILD